MKSTISAILSLILAGAALAGCNRQPDEPAVPPPQAAPEAPAGISAANARLVLPAVTGNPGAVYFDVTNNGAADATIAGAYVDGAKTAGLHTTMQSGGISSMKELSNLPLAKGATVTFAPGGNHVMAMGLAPTLNAGGTTEVTLTFTSGDKISFPATIEPPGGER